MLRDFSITIDLESEKYENFNLKKGTAASLLKVMFLLKQAITFTSKTYFVDFPADEKRHQT